LNFRGLGNFLSKLSGISPSEISLGLRVRVNTTSHYVKTYMHARLDNTQSKPNFSVTTSKPRY